MPQLIAGLTKIEAANRADQLLNMVGLSERVTIRLVNYLGGETARSYCTIHRKRSSISAGG